jgi:hypothetical protein
MRKAEERGKTYAIHKASEKLHDYYGNAMLSVVQFDGYDIKNAYIEGYHKAENDLIDKTLDFLKDKLYENGYVGIIDLCDDYIKAMKDE